MIKERIQIKHDTEANWAKAVNFIPLPGELIIYDGLFENGVYTEPPRIKIGDGIHKLVDLPFLEGGSYEQKATNYQYEDETIKIN
jgi:hypothetical protein